MEAGKVKWENKVISLDLVDAMVKAADSSCSDEEVAAVERSACPTCGSCSGMFTANSMNCLTEALGLSLPGNGTIVATHADRRQLFLKAGPHHRRARAPLLRERRRLGAAAFDRQFQGLRERHQPRCGDGRLHQHRAPPARRGERGGVDFTMQDIDRISRKVPCLCKVAPAVADVHVEDVHRAGGIMAILGELDRSGLLHTELPTVHAGKTMGEALARWDVMQAQDNSVFELYKAAPGASRPRSLSARTGAGMNSTWTARTA